MYFWLPENGDTLGEKKVAADRQEYRESIRGQALAAGLCPDCYEQGHEKKLRQTPVGTGWSNVVYSYQCNTCNFHIPPPTLPRSPYFCLGREGR